MPSLYSSPSFHYISPISRSSSEIRADNANIRKVNSTSSLARSGSGTTWRPTGYRSAAISRSLSRTDNNTSLFGRGLNASVLGGYSPFHTVGVQSSVPHYSDKYPYVRYSYGNTNAVTTLAATTDFSSPSSRHSIRNYGTRSYAEGRVNSYNSNLYSSRSKSAVTSERHITPVRPYVRYMPVDDALSLYKKGHMTVGTLSKYWLTPSAWQSRREKELNLTSSLSAGNYSYASRLANTPSYSRFAHRLSR
uniref:Plakophilin-3 n=1 Tax=Rhabditophanes sp. KR3021 TaxID=114890 RepID=A0AC35TRB4_9BILA